MFLRKHTRETTMIINSSYGYFWRRQWYPTPVLLPGKSHGRRSLAGCSPWGREESDTTERLHFHFSLSCIGEGNGNPLQCSCLQNPRDGGLPSLGSHRVGHDWSDLAAAAAHFKQLTFWTPLTHLQSLTIFVILSIYFSLSFCYLHIRFSGFPLNPSNIKIVEEDLD